MRTLLKYLILLTVFVLCACARKNENTEEQRLAHVRALIKRVGFQQLPYTYDLAESNIEAKYTVDMNSMDTLFFDSGSFGGVLPDTTKYFAFLYYQPGDSLYPFLTTIDKKGNLIDTKIIGIGACRGLLIDIDSCVDKVSINNDLEIELLYKMRGTTETNDSIPKIIAICNQIMGTGKITIDGRIVIYKSERMNCD
ncbi:MAG: hypothetical protein HYZ44_11005 [Bacteroidetes bacterium]|nr:hypothetical protein [Bacteroidota bacterium]